MILTKSPYYLEIPLYAPSEKYIIDLYVWDGDKANPPTEATYQIENKNPLGRTGYNYVNIANYINDFLDISLESSNTTNVINSNSAVWVKYELNYYINDVNLFVAGLAIDLQNGITDLAIKGYGYGNEGKNPSIPSNNVLAYGSEVNISDDTNFTLPILIDESVSTDVTVISYPNNKINKSFTLSNTTDSYELVQNIFVKSSEATNEKYIEIKKDDVHIHTLNIKKEYRYIPIDIWFTNKYGQLYSLTFFKDKTTTLKITDEEYENDKGQPSDGVHQIERFNTNGKEEFKINSGWIKEDNNEILTQLFLANKKWVFDGENFTPINITGKSLEYKTKQRDRLLNYEVSFEYAFNKINTI